MKTLVNFVLSKPSDNLDRASSKINPIMDKWISSDISEVTLTTVNDDLEIQKNTVQNRLEGEHDSYSISYIKKMLLECLQIIKQEVHRIYLYRILIIIRNVD